ncbi:MAG: nitroreductase family protein [Synergistaceae bacterium]|nr:nitroreductase family protein [Synergistaceae bacterium]
MDAIQAMISRRSVRSYSIKPVEQEKIDVLLKAANNAPKTGDLHITVIENRDLLSDINNKTLIAMKNSGNDFLVGRANLPGYQPLYGAPLLLLFSVRDKNPFGQAATASCAATNAANAATALGLGSCYVVSPISTICNDKTIKDRLNIPEAFIPTCGLITGYKEGDDNKFSQPRQQQVDNINYCR